MEENMSWIYRTVSGKKENFTYKGERDTTKQTISIDGTGLVVQKELPLDQYIPSRLTKQVFEQSVLNPEAKAVPPKAEPPKVESKKPEVKKPEPAVKSVQPTAQGEVPF
jgi:hypothetical protein